MKRCCRCGETKPHSDFYVAKREKCGLKSYCKACAKVAQAKWYAANCKRSIARVAAWQKAHPDIVRKHAKATYERHRESRLSRSRAAYACSKATPDRALADRARYEKNRGEILIKAAKYRALVRDQMKVYMRNYRLHNKQRLTSLSNAARVRKQNAPGSHTDAEWQALKDYFGSRCAYCLRCEDECGPLSRDHMLSLKHGGSDDIENIAPACKSCNSSKNAKTLPQFVLYQTQIAQ